MDGPHAAAESGTGHPEGSEDDSSTASVAQPPQAGAFTRIQITETEEPSPTETKSPEESVSRASDPTVPPDPLPDQVLPTPSEASKPLAPRLIRA